MILVQEWLPALEGVVDKLKKAPPGSSSGSVTDPDKMVKVQVASDIK